MTTPRRARTLVADAPRRRPATVADRVRPVVRRGGEPIAPDVRQPMEARFGQSFAHVRLHRDAEAGASAVAIGARAYTWDEHIVFSPGALAPSTPEGRGLLAHELAHVAQQKRDGAPHGEPDRLAAPSSLHEAHASRAATDVLAGRRVEAAHTPPSSGLVHRSLLGAGIGGVLGGLVGGIGLGLLGGLLGPAGAVAGAIIGGIGGLVAGAIIGDRVSRRERGLSGPEREYAREIYHDSVDYDAIRITRDSAGSAGAARTIGNTINLQAEHFKDDTMDLSEAGMLVLIHEMGHVWQYQNGGLAYIPSSLIPQIVAAASGNSRNAAYDWRNAVRNRIEWANWNAEQQAECISDYNEALRRINAGNGQLRDFETVTLAEPYIALVRERIGAPGSSRRRRTPVPAEGTTP